MMEAQISDLQSQLNSMKTEQQSENDFRWQRESN